MTTSSRFQLDLRGLACPQPVVETRRALQELGDNPEAVVRVRVDNPAAAANVTRFAKSQGFAVTEKKIGPEEILLVIGRNPDAASAAPLPDPARQPESAAAAARAGLVYLNSDEMGRGDERLGRLLLKAFLKTLPELETPPAAIILVNRGVFLATSTSTESASLKALAEAGCEILVCGTCLDFYDLKEKLVVGRVSNMFEIASRLAGPEAVIMP